MSAAERTNWQRPNVEAPLIVWEYVQAVERIADERLATVGRQREALEAAAWLAEFLTPEQQRTYQCEHGFTLAAGHIDDDGLLWWCEAHEKMRLVAAALAAGESKP